MIGTVDYKHQQTLTEEPIRNVTGVRGIIPYRIGFGAGAVNHHVRNALQAISYVPYAQQEKQIKMIQDSVKRIEWALREILPGEVENGESAATPHANALEDQDKDALPQARVD